MRSKDFSILSVVLAFLALGFVIGFNLGTNLSPSIPRKSETAYKLYLELGYVEELERIKEEYKIKIDNIKK